MVARPVIITRAEPGASETAARVRAEGFRPVLSPMLELRALAGARPALDGIGNLVFTSANGVRFFREAMSGMEVPAAGMTVWCVGPATMAAARDAGFERLVEGDGNADDLVRKILATGDEGEGFLHVANAAAAGQLVARLRAAGRDARFAALYETVPVPALSPEASGALGSGAPCLVLVHSAKGAEAIRAAVEDGQLATSVLVAISEAAAAPLKGWRTRATVWAERPNEEALIAALNSAAIGL